MDYYSPAAITDQTGAVTERYAFSTFGARTILTPDFSNRSSSECDWAFAFQGQFLDNESGLANYGYRYASPYLGTWMSKDPATEAGGVNLYAFVANNPVNRNDPFGLWTSGPITDTIMTWVGVSNPLKGQSVGLKVCCGTISIDPIAVDADPSQTLDNYAPLVLEQA